MSIKLVDFQGLQIFGRFCLCLFQFIPMFPFISFLASFFILFCPPPPPKLYIVIFSSYFPSLFLVKRLAGKLHAEVGEPGNIPGGVDDAGKIPTALDESGKIPVAVGEA